MKNNILTVLLLVSLASGEVSAGGGKSFGAGLAGGIVGASVVNAASRPREVVYYDDYGYASQDEIDDAYEQGRRDAQRQPRRKVVRYRN